MTGGPFPALLLRDVGSVAVLGRFPAVLQGMELAEWLTEVAVGGFVVVDVKGVEDRLIEHPGFDEPGAVGEVSGGCVAALAEVLALAFDVAELGFDLGLRHGSVRCEVDEVLFLGVEFSELASDLLVQQPRGLILLADHPVVLAAHVGDELLAESEVGVVPLD